MRYLAVPVIWVLFWLAGIVAPPIALLRALVTRSTSPISDTFQAQNRAAATVLGFDGKRTISAECGLRLRENPDCQPCRTLCKALSKVLEHEDHCEKEAQ